MLKKIMNWFTTAIVIFAVVLAILFVGVRAIGFRPFAILSPSMTPEYHVGDLIYVKHEEFKDIKVGDVITCVVDENLTTVTHRVVAVDSEERSFITKGDANNTEDGTPRLYENVVGTVKFSIPLIGYLSIMVTTPTGRYAVIAVAALIVLLLFLPDIIRLYKKSKDNQKEQNG